MAKNTKRQELEAGPDPKSPAVGKQISMPQSYWDWLDKWAESLGCTRSETVRWLVGRRMNGNDTNGNPK